MSPDLRITLVLCAMQVLALSGSLAFQALIPEFREVWALSNTEAGWISSASYVGYAFTAPLLVALTDRVDAKRVVVAACMLSAASGLAFALFAQGFWSGLLWRALAGVGIAGSYMPGLKALADRLQGRNPGRFQSFYTASFSLGSALSLFATGLVAASIGWQGAFAATGLFAAAAATLVLRTVPARPVTRHHPGGAARLPDPRTVLRDRRVMGFILAYAAHAFELFAFRTWIVAFLTFAAATSGAGLDRAGIASLATFLVLLGLPASILGNELASRAGRVATLVVVMALSAAVAITLGLLAEAGFAVVILLTAVYACLVMADSAAITVGTLEVTPAERRGTTIAVQTFLASVTAMTSPMLTGAALDLFGNGDGRGWTAAFGLMAAGALVGPVALLACSRKPGSGRP